MFRSLRFRLPALFLAGVVLAGLVSTIIALGLFQSYVQQQSIAQLRHGDLVIDAGRREVKVGEEEIQLAPKEFDLLWELLDHRGLVLTRDQLLERVWGYTFAGDTRTVDVHVRQLRRKLGDASPIVTVWGVGYKVSPARDATPA
ncbi:MAG: hypothetical protein QOG81_1179 [Gaiellaceae bacterium]|nr:hypothetical protein [Gaiellaceae bacterium]